VANASFLVLFFAEIAVIPSPKLKSQARLIHTKIEFVQPVTRNMRKALSSVLSVGKKSTAINVAFAFAKAPLSA
jgi:hypothetical protein